MILEPGACLQPAEDQHQCLDCPGFPLSGLCPLQPAARLGGHLRQAWGQSSSGQSFISQLQLVAAPSVQPASGNGHMSASSLLQESCECQQLATRVNMVVMLLVQRSSYAVQAAGTASRAPEGRVAGSRGAEALGERAGHLAPCPICRPPASAPDGRAPRPQDYWTEAAPLQLAT